MKKKILISDKLSASGIELLERDKDLEVVNKPGLEGDDLLREIASADALLVRSGTKVTKEVFEAAQKLKIVGRAGIGVDNIDCKEATERGVVVVNTPGGNATTTAEHTIAMMMSLSRYIPQAYRSLSGGKWQKSKFMGTEITGKTLGVVGFGNIGKIVAERGRGLAMRVLVSDPFLSAEVAAKHEVELVPFEDLCARADYITVHVPLNDQTKNLIGNKAIGRMKVGVRILNCARGGIVDEKALLDGLESGKIAGAALDVFTEEPPPADHPILAHERVIFTPHLGASTEEAQVNVAVQVAEQVRDYLKTGEIRNAINFPSVSSEMLQVMRPYLQLCEKIGSFQGQINQGGKVAIKRLQIHYRGEVADYNRSILTSTLIQAFLKPLLSAPINFINAKQVAQSRGITVEETLQSQVKDFANEITLEVTADRDTKHILTGAVFGKNHLRFVRFEDFYLEVVPSGYLLIIHNYDRPGVVGKIGSILGQAKVNISRMQLALDRDIAKEGTGKQKDDRAQAVTFLNIDQPASEQVQDELRKLSDIIALYQVNLD